MEHMVFAGIPVYLAVSYYSGQSFVHYALLLAVIVYMAIIAGSLNTRHPDLGIVNQMSRPYAWQLLITTFIIASAILLGKYFGLIHDVIDKNWQLLLIYIFISVPLQEFVFRSFCVWRCELSWNSRLFIALFTTGNFAYYHFTFGSWQLVVGVLIINLYWSYWYFRQRNIFAVMLSHALIGAVYFM